MSGSATLLTSLAMSRDSEAEKEASGRIIRVLPAFWMVTVMSAVSPAASGWPRADRVTSTGGAACSRGGVGSGAGVGVGATYSSAWFTVTDRVWGLPLPLRAMLSFRSRPLPLYITPAQVRRRVSGSSGAERTSTPGVQAEKLSSSLLKS